MDGKDVHHVDGELETKKSGDFYWSKDDVSRRPSRISARPRRVVPRASLPAAMGSHVCFHLSAVQIRRAEPLTPLSVDVRPLTLNHLRALAATPQEPHAKRRRNPREVPADQGPVQPDWTTCRGSSRREPPARGGWWMGNNASWPVLLLTAYVVGGFAL